MNTSVRVSSPSAPSVRESASARQAASARDSAPAREAAPAPPDPSSRVIVVGGAGQVGRAIVTALAPLLPGRLVVAGRTVERAREAAAAIGHGASALRLDVADPALVADPPPAAAVVMCIDERPPELVAAWLARGVHYVDVTATPERIAEIEPLDAVAREGGASALLSVGVAPGLTNLLAAEVTGGFDAPPEVELLVQLGLGDSHGPAAIEWTLDGLADRAALRERRRFTLPGRTGASPSRAAASDAAAQPTAAPGPAPSRAAAPDPAPSCAAASDAAAPPPGARRSRSLTAYRFPFPEERVLPRTLGVASASSWLALDPPLATAPLAWAARAGAGRLLARERRRSRAAALKLLGAAGALPGSDACVLAARARGVRDGRPHERQLALAGRREAELTALVAASATAALLGVAPELLTARPLDGAPRDRVPQRDLIPHSSAQSPAAGATAPAAPPAAAATAAPSGVHHIEQVLALAPLLARLRAAGAQLDLRG